MAALSILAGIIGGQEIIIIAIIILVLFGGKKIPELMRGLGRGIREFKDASNATTNDIMKEFKDDSETFKTTEKNQEKSE